MPSSVSVVHINATDSAGGTARAGYRIHEGLKRLGARSRVLVGWKFGEDADVDTISAGPGRVLDRLCARATDRASLQYLFIPSSLALPSRRWVREADVIQLYSSHGGYFSHTILPRLSRLRPVVWRLSDMWPLTGHCAYSYGCERWKTGCGACPLLEDYPSLRHDRTAFLWRTKRRLYRDSRLVIVSPSQWLAGLVRQSPLLGERPLHVIPTGVDTEIFHPMPKAEARALAGIEPGGPVLFFNAQFLDDRRKGAVVLTQALERLSPDQRRQLRLVTVGALRDRRAWQAPVPTAHLGPIDDDRRLAALYAAADLCVLPTLADNLPNSALESLACGTPVVSFRVGGVPEVVRHLETGYLAAPEDAGELARGLARLLDDEPLRARLGGQGRTQMLDEHTLDRQAGRFLDLYRQMLERDGG